MLDHFSNRLGINEVFFVGLHKWLHELRRDQPDVVAVLLHHACKEMGSRTRFEADQRSLHVRRES